MTFKPLNKKYYLHYFSFFVILVDSWTVLLGTQYLILKNTFYFKFFKAFFFYFILFYECYKVHKTGNTNNKHSRLLRCVRFPMTSSTITPLQHGFVL